MPLSSFESSCLHTFRAGKAPAPIETIDNAALARYGLWMLLRIAALARSKQLSASAIKLSLKSDGSPVTQLELDIEDLVRSSLPLLPQGTVFISEEAGGLLPQSGLAIVLDPIDGTRSFLTQSDNYATSLAFYRDGTPLIGMVVNPATGDLGYVMPGASTRLIQLSLLGREDLGVTLPVIDPFPRQPCLVHVHPSRKAAALMSGLYGLWNQGTVQFVKSAGGSPAYALLEAAKGHFIYVNLWGQRPAAPHDLTAGVLLVRGAGGDVIDVHGNPINGVNHAGPFIAAVRNDGWKDVIRRIIDLVRSCSEF